MVLLAGAAVMQVDGDQVALEPGGWAFLPAHVPHSVIETTAGTSWLALHLPRLITPDLPG